MELCCSPSNTSIAPLFFMACPKAQYCKHNYSKRSWITCASSNTSSEGGQMSIAITGATGFIGRRLVQKLLADDHNIHVLTRSRSQAQLVFPGKKLRSFQK